MELEELHKVHWDTKFPLPDLNKNVEMYVPVRDESDDLVTVGLIKKFHEVIFITDMMKSPYKRMRGIIQASEELQKYLKAVNAEQVSVFVNREDVKFAKMLVNNFGFKLVKDIPLVRNL